LNLLLSLVMHELSIALGIVNVAEAETAKANMDRVEHIELEIGALAGIEMEALDFVWPSAVKGTVLEEAVKKITIVQGEAQCQQCQSNFRLKYLHETCPACGSYLKTITKGKELLVKSLELSINK
jgi:hydrogenase nickel incorporation protein HypA/HybF